MNSAEKKLAIAIARCGNVNSACNDVVHPCHEVVNFQRHSSDRHIPEAWFGNLSRAKVLLISSNPSIDVSESSVAENYPRSHWSDDDIAEWVTRRTDQTWDPVPVTFEREGSKNFLWRCADGQYRGSGSANSPQPTWNKTHRRVKELLGTQANPSLNYALTEVVHCKSQREIGVAKAISTCSSMWMTEIVETAECASVVVSGSKVVEYWARDFFNLPSEYGRSKKGGIDPARRTSRDIFISTAFGRPRVFLHMGQPAFSRSLNKLYGTRVVELLGKIARQEIEVPEDTLALQALLGYHT